MKLGPALGIVAVALCVSGCAGGGGSSGSGSVTTTPPSTSSFTSTTPVSSAAQAFRTVQYLRLGALDQINAANAYSLGYSGQGVTIGIVDFNFNFSAGEVNYSSASVGPNSQMQALYLAQPGATAITDPHGEATASVAAAFINPASNGIQGVAYNAQVLAVDYFSDVDNADQTIGGVLYHVSDPFTYITSHGVKIISISYGYESQADGGTTLSPPSAGSQTYAVVSAAQGIENGALVVVAAGNGHPILPGSNIYVGDPNPSQSNIDIVNSLPSGTLANGPGGLIIAGAVDSNNQIASFSDQAGTLMNNYMVAPGVGLTVPWQASGFPSGFAIADGTSFAAPQIAGAAALLLQRWPFLTGIQLANILLDTATDLGAPGVDPVYGHGLLNVYAALQPNGVTTFAVSGSVTPTVATSATILSPAFGDAAQLRTALSQVLIVDKFGRGFEVDAAGLVATRPNIPDLLDIVEQRFGWDGADVPVGTDTRFSFDVLRTPADEIAFAPGLGNNGPDRLSPETTFRLTGAGGGVTWSAGRGLSLSDALAGDQNGDPFAASSLTGAFSPMAQTGTGNFVTASLPLSDATDFSFGLYGSQNQDETDQLSTPYHDTEEAAAVRLDHYVSDSRLSVEMGMLTETGGLLGSLASGGLKLADRSATGWTTFTGETWLSNHWSLEESFTLSVSGATHPQASLITEIGTVFATSFAIGVTGNDVLGDGDRLSFTFSQPLRAESAPVTLAYGVAQDPVSGNIIMGQTQSSLVPSGREFDLETAYRWPLEDWAAECNFAYRIDPDDVRASQGFVALASVSRKF